MHSGYVVERISSRNNILKALAGTSWGQQKETSLMTYKAVGRSIINYAAHVWSTNLRDTYYRNIQYTQNEALRITTGCHKMSSVDHLHVEAKMLKVMEHSELLCCCLPTPMTLASGGSPMFPHVVHQPASPSIWPAVQSLRRGLSTNPGVTMWCVCGCS